MSVLRLLSCIDAIGTPEVLAPVYEDREGAAAVSLAAAIQNSKRGIHKISHVFCRAGILPLICLLEESEDLGLEGFGEFLLRLSFRLEFLGKIGTYCIERRGLGWGCYYVLGLP